MVHGLFIWWYGAGFKQSWQVALYFLARTGQFFSIESLLTTWLSPWKNDVAVGDGLSLKDQINLGWQNLVSRLVGATIRTIVLIVGFVSLAILALLLAAGLIIWLVTPALIVILLALAARTAYH